MFAGLESNDLLANGRYKPIDFQCFTYVAKKLAWHSWEYSLIFPSLNRGQIPPCTDAIQQMRGALTKFYYRETVSLMSKKRDAKKFQDWPHCVL